MKLYKQFPDYILDIWHVFSEHKDKYLTNNIGYHEGFHHITRLNVPIINISEDQLKEENYEK